MSPVRVAALVFRTPPARAFFEALIADNLDIGRPDHVEVIFAGHPRRWGRPPKQEPTYKTRIDTRDTIGVTANADYKHSRIKQYMKECRGRRCETRNNQPAEGVPHQDVGAGNLHRRQPARQFGRDDAGRSRSSGRAAPSQTRTIIADDCGEPGNLRFYQGPTQRGGRNARFENYRRVTRT